jgi:hypothetical protein
VATTFNFQNRFSYPAPDGISPSVNFDTTQTLSDNEIEGINPSVGRFASVVREHSVLLSQKTTLEIFNVLTQQVDPRISLFLAAAKRRQDNTPLFLGLGQIWEVMFSDTTRVPAGNGSGNASYFSDGIFNAAATWVASILIGQLAQVKEQFEHSKYKEEQAILDLEKICYSWEITATAAKITGLEDIQEQASFYFEQLDFTVDPSQQLSMYWYSPTFSREWQYVKTYAGALSTWMLVSDLADSVNSAIPPDSTLSLLAVAQLSGPTITSTPLHALSFYPRYSQPGVLAYSINVRIQLEPTGAPNPLQSRTQQTKTPFRWGPFWNSINNFYVNGAIVITDFNRLSSTALQQSEIAQPIVVYLKNSVEYTAAEPAIIPPDNSRLVIRAQPWQPGLAAQKGKPIETVLTIPRLQGDTAEEQQDLDNARFSQVALAILNALADSALETRATGAIIRNDPLDKSQPMAAVELVAWGITQVNAYVLLDILEVPSDIEIALGDRLSPFTLFSSKPRTIRVHCVHVKGTNSIAQQYIGRDKPHMSARLKSQAWAAIKDEALTVDDRIWI